MSCLRGVNLHVCSRLYVPEFASSLSVSVSDCSSGDEADGGTCPLVLRVGPVTVNCSETTCTAALSNPPWDAWLRVDVENSRDNRSVAFTVVSNYTGGSTNPNHTHTHTRYTLQTLTAPLCFSGLQASQRGPSCG